MSDARTLKYLPFGCRQSVTRSNPCQSSPPERASLSSEYSEIRHLTGPYTPLKLFYSVFHEYTMLAENAVSGIISSKPLCTFSFSCMHIQT